MACNSSDWFCSSSACKNCRTCKDRCKSFNFDSGKESACKSACEADSSCCQTAEEYNEISGDLTPRRIN